jgi:hypothetical protein
MDQNKIKEQDNEQRKSARLKEIRRARNRLFVCFWTFPVYVVAVMQVLESGNETNLIMMAYMALYAGFGANLATKRCPNCHQQYFVKSFFLNPFKSQCAHCALPLKHEGSLGA